MRYIYNNNNKNYNNLSEKLYDAVKAADKFLRMTKRIEDALNSVDRNFIIKTINDELESMKEFINKISYLTRIRVKEAPISFFNDKDLKFLYDQLNIIKFEMLLKVICESGYEHLIIKTLETNYLDNNTLNKFKDIK